MDRDVGGMKQKTELFVCKLKVQQILETAVKGEHIGFNTIVTQ